ncbi:hypothetical protein CEP50_16785 [Actinopolyspora mortivallis]|uniref:Uncharacterized protein n=1 Tax=Actinopolyspora mortivallis TaxID=33906 RepID=A0A2T0GSU4_ACTMO|nr:hypothetical protein CEP50_16785 [Actinopolyspora mortivallis]
MNDLFLGRFPNELSVVDLLGYICGEFAQFPYLTPAPELLFQHFTPMSLPSPEASALPFLFESPSISLFSTDLRFSPQTQLVDTNRYFPQEFRQLVLESPRGAIGPEGLTVTLDRTTHIDAEAPTRHPIMFRNARPGVAPLFP